MNKLRMLSGLIQLLRAVRGGSYKKGIYAAAGLGALLLRHYLEIEIPAEIIDQIAEGIVAAITLALVVKAKNAPLPQTDEETER